MQCNFFFFFSFRYVKYIVEHEDIYSRAPIELKRCIWTDNHTLFQKELQPIISQYLVDVDEQLLTECLTIQY